MSLEILLPAMDLADGRSIQPPAGWLKEGWVTDNKLGLAPKSRLRWTPSEREPVALHWELSRAPLPGEVMSELVLALLRGTGPVAEGTIRKLHPALVLIPLHAITLSQVICLPGYGHHLQVEYILESGAFRGLVLYAPTTQYAQGEYQLLAYEGREPFYSAHLSIATRSIYSFRRNEPAPENSAATPEPEEEQEYEIASASPPLKLNLFL